MAPEAELVVLLAEPMQRCNDLLEFPLHPLLLAQRHLLLLNGVHSGEPADRLVETDGLSLLRRGL